MYTGFFNANHGAMASGPSSAPAAGTKDDNDDAWGWDQMDMVNRAWCNTYKDEPDEAPGGAPHGPAPLAPISESEEKDNYKYDDNTNNDDFNAVATTTTTTTTNDDNDTKITTASSGVITTASSGVKCSLRPRNEEGKPIQPKKFKDAPDSKRPKTPPAIPYKKWIPKNMKDNKPTGGRPKWQCVPCVTIRGGIKDGCDREHSQTKRCKE